MQGGATKNTGAPILTGAVEDAKLTEEFGVKVLREKGPKGRLFFERPFGADDQYIAQGIVDYIERNSYITDIAGVVPGKDKNGKDNYYIELRTPDAISPAESHGTGKHKGNDRSNKEYVAARMQVLSERENERTARTDRLVEKLDELGEKYSRDGNMVTLTKPLEDPKHAQEIVKGLNTYAGSQSQDSAKVQNGLITIDGDKIGKQEVLTKRAVAGIQAERGAEKAQATNIAALSRDMAIVIGSKPDAVRYQGSSVVIAPGKDIEETKRAAWVLNKTQVVVAPNSGGRGRREDVAYVTAKGELVIAHPKSLTREGVIEAGTTIDSDRETHRKLAGYAKDLSTFVGESSVKLQGPGDQYKMGEDFNTSKRANEAADALSKAIPTARTRFASVRENDHGRFEVTFDAQKLSSDKVNGLTSGTIAAVKDARAGDLRDFPPIKKAPRLEDEPAAPAPKAAPAPAKPASPSYTTPSAPVASTEEPTLGEPVKIAELKGPVSSVPPLSVVPLSLIPTAPVVDTVDTILPAPTQYEAPPAPIVVTAVPQLLAEPVPSENLAAIAVRESEGRIAALRDKLAVVFEKLTPEKEATAKDAFAKAGQTVQMGDMGSQSYTLAQNTTGVRHDQTVYCGTCQRVNDQAYYYSDIGKQGVAMHVAQNDRVLMQADQITSGRNVELHRSENAKFGFAVPKDAGYDLNYDEKTQKVTLTIDEKGKEQKTITVTNVTKADLAHVVISEHNAKDTGRSSNGSRSAATSVQDILAKKDELNLKSQRTQLAKQFDGIKPDGTIDKEEFTAAVAVIQDKKDLREALGIKDGTNVDQIKKALTDAGMQLDKAVDVAAKPTPNMAERTQETARK